MSDDAEKVRENRVRRGVQRQGYRLEKCRARDPRAVSYGLFRIVDPGTNTVQAGSDLAGYSMSVDDVERWLAE